MPDLVWIDKLRVANADLLEHIRKDRATFADAEIAADMLGRSTWAAAMRVAKQACDEVIAKAEAQP